MIRQFKAEFTDITISGRDLKVKCCLVTCEKNSRDICSWSDKVELVESAKIKEFTFELSVGKHPRYFLKYQLFDDEQLLETRATQIFDEIMISPLDISDREVSFKFKIARNQSFLIKEI